MREFFYTLQEIRDSFERWNPRLHRYAQECRAARPVPARESLSIADAAKLGILVDGVKEVRAKSGYCRAPLTRIVHGSELTLLAFQEVFESDETGWLSLLSDEWMRWQREVFSGAPEWFTSNWVTIHDPVPHELVEYVDAAFDVPRGSQCWVLTVARGGGARHELWAWREQSAFRLGVVMQQCTEDVTIDSFEFLPNEFTCRETRSGPS